MKIAASLICRASDTEAEVLKRALESLGPHVDKIYVTITGENKACEEVCEFYGAVASHFTWINDFAAARNFAFAQVPKDYDYIAWVDADDITRGWEKLKETVEAHPDVDVFVQNYLYAFDEHNNPTVVHLKTRVVRNDGCVEWVGALHEDFHETRQLTAKFLEGIEVLHLTTEDRIKTGTERNLTVARASVSDDPRSLWNLGNALRQAGQNDEALKTFVDFLNKSQSDEEKYIVRLRLAEIYFERKEFAKALDETRYAIGTRPNYPDAYHMAGHTYFEMKRYNEARDNYLMGLKRKPPYYNIIVYNPRDYDYVPLMALAKTYFNLSLPSLALECLKGCAKIYPEANNIKELITHMETESARFEGVLTLVERLKTVPDDQLQAELDKVEPDLRSHPALCQLRNTRLVKTESSGKDMVFMCGFTEEAWTPETARTKGIGGSEEAVINLSKQLASKGWNVTVYNNCGHKMIVEDGVTYKPFWEWNYRDKQDVLILWRHPRLLDHEINAAKIFVDLHDVVPPGEFNEARLKKVSKIFVKSQAHRKLFPLVPDEQFCIIPNGINWDTLQDASIERDPYLMLNTSSPDRSLSSFVEVFKRVKAQIPEVKAVWAYGWGNFQLFNSDNPAALAWQRQIEEETASLEGFTALGRVSHGEVARLYQQAGVFCYPTAFYEIDCISLRKAIAGGAWPVTSDFAALNETGVWGDKIHVDPEHENWGKPYAFNFAVQNETALAEMADKVVQAMSVPPVEDERTCGRTLVKNRDWLDIAKQWNGELSAE